jgi:hypothetical protein
MELFNGTLSLFSAFKMNNGLASFIAILPAKCDVLFFQSEIWKQIC